MQMVIDIPDERELIDKAIWWDVSDFDAEDIVIIIKAIAKGTPLPKGHGRLKDTDAICKDIISALGIRDENYLLEAEEAIYKRIKNAPTIIEADNAESEGEE